MRAFLLDLGNFNLLDGFTLLTGPVAQWIRRWSSEPKIVGSSPTGVINKDEYLFKVTLLAVVVGICNC